MWCHASRIPFIHEEGARASVIEEFSMGTTWPQWSSAATGDVRDTHCNQQAMPSRFMGASLAPPSAGPNNGGQEMGKWWDFISLHTYGPHSLCRPSFTSTPAACLLLEPGQGEFVFFSFEINQGEFVALLGPGRLAEGPSQGTKHGLGGLWGPG